MIERSWRNQAEMSLAKKNKCPTNAAEVNNRVKSWARLSAKSVWQRYVASRSLGLLAMVALLFWHAGWEADGQFVGDALLTVFGVVVLNTRTGRAIVFLAWLMLIGLALFNLQGVVQWEAVKTLLVVIGLGALWFVDWRRVLTTMGCWLSYSKADQTTAASPPVARQ
jgi:hypothetical protein